MLSILIPTYNHNPSVLIASLSEEIRSAGLSAEILVADDASDLTYELIKDSRLSFFPLEKNIGRSAIRNFLADQASGDSFLFIDADSVPVETDFLQRYLSVLKAGEIVCGGTAYQKDAPDDFKKHLRWNYGRHREALSVEKRSENGFHSFMSNNFLITRTDFFSLTFDESIRFYGHEDTLFGLNAQKLGLSIKHIENPVYHLGLEDAKAFMLKTMSAVKNLCLLANQKPELQRELKMASALLRKHQQMNALKLGFTLSLSRKLFGKCIEKRLEHEKISLHIFDFWRLLLMHKCMQELTEKS